jgi:hypothetical protein
MTTPQTAPTAHGSATLTPFSLSVLTVQRGSASKRIIAGAQGQPVKGQGSLAIMAGVLEHVQVAGLSGLQTLLMSIRTDQALVHGVVKGSSPTHAAPLVTTEALKQAKPGTLEPGTVARSLEYIAYPEGCFLLMLDRDDNPEDPTRVTTAEALIPLLTPLLPGIEHAGRLMTTSTSSGIKSKATGAWLIPPTGSHTYFLARGDLKRFVDLLTVRLWNANYGYCKLATPNTQTGVAAVLVRALVDLSVFSPERLDYVAGARIAKNAPFYQDRGEPRLVEGDIFDLDALPDITPEERQQYHDRLTAAKAARAPERVAQVKAVVEAADATLTPDQVTAIVQQRLEHHEGRFLPPEYLLHFFHRTKAVAVQDLSADYDGLRLADPHEPDYRDGTDAVFHWRGGDWLINSFAHGLLRTYRAVPVPPPDPDEEDFQNLLQQAAADAHRRGNGHGGPATRPLIQITPDVTGVVDDAVDALRDLPAAPVVYQRARRVCLISRAGKPPQWLRRQADIPIIQEAPPSRLWELLAQAADWEKYDERKKDWKRTTPPPWSVEVIRGRSPLPFPMLEGIVCSPTMRPDGSLLVTQGYDPATGLYVDFNGTVFPTIPIHPTLDDARSALRQLQEVFQDFPFADRTPRTPTDTAHPTRLPTRTSSFSAVLAAVLTVVGRPAIQGNVPLFGVTATAAGTGKGKLVDAIVIIGTGRCAPKMGQTLDENEELKRLLALALEGAAVCCIDNVVHPLGNQYLDMALTAQTITGRILGQSVTGEAPWNAVMFATGNNLAYRGDMVRRVVPIALDPKMEKPEERTTFRHPNLEAWVLTNRPRFVSKALTILRAYCVAKRPAQQITPYGSFESWSDLIRSAVVWLGEADPCEGRQDLAAQTDERYEQLATLLEAWKRCYPQKADGTPWEKTLKEVKQEIALYAANKDQIPNTWDQLRDALVPFDRRSDGKSLNTHLIGNALRTIEGRVIAQQRLMRCGESQKTALWRLEDL